MVAAPGAVPWRIRVSVREHKPEWMLLCRRASSFTWLPTMASTLSLSLPSLPGRAGVGLSMRRTAYLLLIPTLLLLLALPVSWGRYNDDFDDGEDLAEFDDNDFAEFEDMSDDLTAEAETVPPPRVSSSQPEEDEDEDEATVELEDGLDGFEDSETQVGLLCSSACIPVSEHYLKHISLFIICGTTQFICVAKVISEKMFL